MLIDLSHAYNNVWLVLYSWDCSDYYHCQSALTYRLVFLNELSEGTVNAYRRNGDNTLTLVQVEKCRTLECY